MARKRVVTRTIATNEITLLCLNTISAEPFNTTIKLSASIKGEKAIMKEAHKLVDTDEVKAVAIVDQKQTKTFYEMDEQYYITHANVVEKN